MLIRANGARAGIREYLEKGQMKDRFFDRDQLDHREILTGDLTVIDEIINNYDNEGEKYFHFTLSFKEDYVSKEDLHKITQEFREFYFRAYTNDEVCFYAEAHLPKLKSYQDKSTGELVERKPHIHVIVPKVNLLTGQSVSFQERYNIQYMEAFQEYINCKYGLESPTDNRRTKFNSRSEVISRYKGDIFNGIGKEHKEKIFQLIMEHNSSSFQDLHRVLLHQGYKIRTRNAAIPNKAYLNIIPEHENKGINLKEFVFSEEFLQLPLEEKHSYINFRNEYRNLPRDKKLSLIESNMQLNSLYIQAGMGKVVQSGYMDKLKEWNDMVAYQRKYIDRSGKGERNKFKGLDYLEKMEFLKQKQEQFYSTYGVNDYGISQSELEQLINRYREVAVNNLQSAANNFREISGTIERSASNEIRNVSREWRRQRRDEYARLIGGGEKRYFYDTLGRGEYTTKDRRYTFIDTITLDYINDKISNSEIKDELKYFKDILKADVLLELLEKTHGVIPEKYAISINKDGKDRIRCGTYNYSVVDFCIKELYLPWNETLKLLKTAELMQREIDREQGWSVYENKYLADEYKIWLVDFKKLKDTELNALQFKIKAKYEEIKKKYKGKNDEVAKSGDGYHKREEKRRVLKMEKLLESRALQEAKAKELQQIRSKYNLDMQESYRKFLIYKAEVGDEMAVQELRRLRVDFEEYQKTGSIRHVDRYMEYRLDVSHKIDNQGIITYTLKRYSENMHSYIHMDIIKDIGKRIDILDNNVDSIKLALDLAITKYGKHIELFGSAEFRKQLVSLAIQNNYEITFKDSFSENYRRELISDMRNSYNLLEQGNMSFSKEGFKNLPDLLVTDIVKIDALDYNGKYVELTKIILLDINTKQEYQVDSKQLSSFGCYSKLNKGDMLKIDGAMQNRITVNAYFWNKYTADLYQGALISSFINDNKVVIELPKWKQAQYEEKYFTIEQPGLSQQLENIGYFKGDLVSINPVIDVENKEISYKFSIIADGKDKAQAKKDLWREDINKARELLSARNNIKQEELSKEVSGRVIDFGTGQYKGTQSSFIVMENANLRVNNKVLVQKEEFCRKHKVAIYNLEKEVVGKVIDFGVSAFQGNEIKNSKSFYLELMTSYGVRKIWGKDIERMLTDNNISKNDNIYMAKIGHNKSAYVGSSKVMYKYECMKLSEAQMANANDYIAPLYCRYWNSQFKELIDNKLIVKNEYVYFAKVGEHTNVKHDKKNNFMTTPITLDIIKPEIRESQQVSEEVKSDKFDAVLIGKNINGRAIRLINENKIDNSLQNTISK
ncbi:MAG: relaxase/mobilization nuclease domain-containing protein [Burkholderiales bacterium]|nr:relaxase/mobilization nuclease domain-containing protein [Burkholderiales bacterium]